MCFIRFRAGVIDLDFNVVHIHWNSDQKTLVKKIAIPSYEHFQQKGDINPQIHQWSYYCLMYGSCKSDFCVPIKYRVIALNAAESSATTLFVTPVRFCHQPVTDDTREITSQRKSLPNSPLNTRDNWSPFGTQHYSYVSWMNLPNLAVQITCLIHMFWNRALPCFDILSYFDSV